MPKSFWDGVLVVSCYFANVFPCSVSNERMYCGNVQELVSHVIFRYFLLMMEGIESVTVGFVRSQDSAPHSAVFNGPAA